MIRGEARKTCPDSEIPATRCWEGPNAARRPRRVRSPTTYLLVGYGGTKAGSQPPRLTPPCLVSTRAGGHNHRSSARPATWTVTDVGTATRGRTSLRGNPRAPGLRISPVPSPRWDRCPQSKGGRHIPLKVSRVRPGASEPGLKLSDGLGSRVERLPFWASPTERTQPRLQDKVV